MNNKNGQKGAWHRKNYKLYGQLISVCKLLTDLRSPYYASTNCTVRWIRVVVITTEKTNSPGKLSFSKPYQIKLTTCEPTKPGCG